MNSKEAQKDAHHIGQIISGLLQNYRSDSNIDIIRVGQLWQQSVAEDIYENSRPWAFKGSVLLVHVANSAWIQQLQFYKRDIIRGLNSAMGNSCITDIKFKVGPING